MTSADQDGTTTNCEIVRRPTHSELDEWQAKWTVSLAARVLTHLRGRARSHPDNPATGHYLMPDAEWRACIAELRRRGYRITESIVAQGDHAANEIGYTLAGGPQPTNLQPSAGMQRRGAPRPGPGWSTDRSPALY